MVKPPDRVSHTNKKWTATNKCMSLTDIIVSQASRYQWAGTVWFYLHTFKIR